MTAAPADLARWSLHCFCLKARSNPKRVIALDNNGEVLFHLGGGATSSELRFRGIDVTASQLALLEAYGLIVSDGERYRTRIPVLGPSQIEPVRDEARKLARTTISDVITHAAEISGQLSDRGLAGSVFAVVFGHALDGLIWDVLREWGSVPEVDLTIHEPFWRGTFWALYPGRDGSAGTNEVHFGEARLVAVWDDATADGLARLTADPQLQGAMGAIRSKTRSVVVGGLPVPVIAATDPVQRASLVMAQTVAASISGAPLLADVGVDVTPEDATVIVAHEVIWEVSDLLESSGVISPPRPTDLASRLFVRLD